MIYSMIVAIIFFAALAIFLVRLLSEAGLLLPGNRVFSFVCEKHRTAPSGNVERGELAKVFIAALVFRLAVFAAGWFARGIFTDKGMVSLLDYFEGLSMWDGPHYLEIAQNGYTRFIEDSNYYMLVFFPLYPAVIRLFALAIRNYAVSALTVSTLAYCAGCVMMYKLVTLDYSKSIARASIVFLSVAPFAFFYGSVMSESLFFLLTISTFYAIRRHKWLLAGILGMLTALTRSFGVFMIIVAAIEWIQYVKPLELIRHKDLRQLAKHVVRVLPLLIIPIGTLIYLFINYKVTGNPFIFVQYQREHWSMTIQFFGKTAHMLWERVTAGNDSWTHIASMFMPELILLPIFTLLMLYSARRVRSMYMVFMLIYFVFNAGASWPLSLPRYLACMFPVYWVIAEFTDRHKSLEAPLAALSAVAFGVFLAGYVTYHSIM